MTPAPAPQPPPYAAPDRLAVPACGARRKALRLRKSPYRFGKWAIVLPVALCVCALPARAATYYIDSRDGTDTANGLSPTSAWQSLDPVNARTFSPGDRILLKSGSRLTGRLRLQGSGEIREGHVVPIYIDQFGEGPLPRIETNGQFPEALLVHDVGFWEIRNLELTNRGPDRQPGRTGVRVSNGSHAPVRHIHLADLYVHDVNSDLRKSHEGAGILFQSAGPGSRFDDMIIERCHLVRTDRNGICQRADNAARSTGVVVRDNLLEDIGGDGIKIWGSDDARVERNVLRGGRTRCQDAAAGIWPWDSDRTVIEYNEVSGMKGTRDGQGFDADYRCRDTLIQYNYSHDNQGGFLLVCTPRRSYCERTVVRYNVSQNDGMQGGRVIQIAGAPRDTKIYNNTIYAGPALDLPMISFNEWDGGWADNTSFANNIFYADGRVSYRLGNASKTTFTHNVFYGRHDRPPADRNANAVKPALAAPGSGGAGFTSLAGYRWIKSASPVVGVFIPDHGPRDFFGTPVPDREAPTVGAHQQP